MPLAPLGFFAKAKGAATSYESIATVTVGAGGSSSISFTSIPSTYTHLQIRWLGRGTATMATGETISIRFNSDSTSGNYKSHYLEGNGSAASAGALSTNNYAVSYNMSGSNSTTGVFGAGIIDILDYTSTSKNKTLRNLGGYDNNGSGYIDFNSSLWLKTPEAINRIDLTVNFAVDNFAQYSSFALYGIRG